ncbi:MAG: cystathionine beta-synthase [Vicinamibacterales bacterium]|jgi:cystathionine beta-synthase|nr:cystathionine beta-synthase [Acidobacteriota bacterium]MDP7295422.1 cystathionine beta-synthase [Vicinamibacterales bacterium]HJO39362.1 cystathionine beta-synthase [Vicinamibacterales bacterium]|tara:strand:- start:42 stop:1457 length:1416 start_codon:yes stop_codon:yes gene_type:complete
MLANACSTILDAIGHTPLVKLNRVARDVDAAIYVKCEYMNPGGSMKDRMTLNMVDQAETRGDLTPGGTIIEATSGNTGAGLAMIAAVRGYHCVFVMPDKMSTEKIASLKAFGARVVVCPTAVEPEDPRSYYSVAKKLHADTPNSFYANQYHNQDNPGGHYLSTGPEIWEQTEGKIDVFVAGMGTGGTMAGTGRYLKEQKPSIQLVGVDPVGSLYYDFVKSQRITKAFTYKVEGIGEDFFPTTFDPKWIDDIVRVDDKECFLMARDLVRLEGLYAGGSAGAAVAGAVKFARQAHKRQNIVVLLPDGAAKYLSKVFNDEWLRENGFLEDEWGLGTVADLLAHRPAKVITAKAGDRVRDVIAKMKSRGISQLPVLSRGTLLGAVAEVDLLRYLAAGEHSLDTRVDALVESDYATVSSQTRIELVQNLLADTRMAIVLEGDDLIGVITKIDLITYLARPMLRRSAARTGRKRRKN